jgi:phage terminase large subunit
MRSKNSHAKINSIYQTIQDPTQFARVFLASDLWGKQDDILRSVGHHRRTAVRACHASGKTFAAAIAALWWITTHPKDGIVIITAPTWLQVEKVLWPEIHKAVQRSRITYPVPSATELKLGPGRYAVGLSTNEGVRFQGFHGSILIIIDEAPGVRPEIYEAIAGIQAGGDVRMLALGNPTIASGPFYDAFTTNREGWNLISISAFDTPNLQGISLDALLKMTDQELDQNPWPSLTTRRWVREKYYEWGLGNPLWESRVLGNFPAQSDDSLLSLEWLERAKLRETEEVTADGDNEDICGGLDVAGPGEDETALTLRRGSRIILIEAWTDSDPRGKVLNVLRDYKSRIQRLNVDTAGMGYYFARHFEDHGYPVVDVNVGVSSRDPEKYANLKAELCWGVRMRLEAGDFSGLTDERTIGQLAGIRYKHNSRGQVVIESKEEARKRGVKSPDRAEAVMLAFAEVRYAEPNIRILTDPGWDKASELGWRF